MSSTPFSLTDGDKGLLTGFVGSASKSKTKKATALVPRSASKKRLRTASTGSGDPTSDVSAAVLARKLEEAELLRERDLQNHRLEMKQAEVQADKLKRQVKFLGVEEETLRGKLARKERKWLEEKQALEEQTDGLQKTKRSLEADVEELRATLSETMAQVDRLNSMLDARAAQLSQMSSSQADSLATLQADLEAAHEQASRVPVLEQRLEAAQSEVERLEAQRAAAGLAAASGGFSEDAEREMRKMREHLHVSERKERSALAELKRLRSQQRNTELLERKLASATRRAEQAAEEVTRLSVLEVKMKALQAEKHRWAESFKQILAAEEEAAKTGSTGSSFTVQGMELTPDLVLAVVRGLQDQRLELLSEKGAAEAAAKSSGKTADVHQRRVRELQDELAASEDKRIAAEERSLRLDRRCQLAQRETKSLKSVLETYRLEEEAADQEKDKDLDADAKAKKEADKKAKDTLITHLETSLAAAKTALAKYDTEAAVLASPDVKPHTTKRSAEMAKELDDANAKIGRLTKALEAVEKENAALMSRVAKGDFNPATTKVVHLAMNPTAKALKKEEDWREERIKVLEKEVTALQAKLEGDDETGAGGDGGGGGGGGAGATSGGSALADSKELETLKLRHQRLKEVFREKISTFREALYLLTGYKVDMTVASASSLTQLRLKSMYAERENDYLLFHLKGGKLELLGTEFCQRIDSKIIAYLTTLHSIPAFLSSVTLDLFEKQTFLG